MMSSVILKKITNVSFVKVEINVKTCKLVLQEAFYNLTPEELMEELQGRHRVILPCKIIDDVASFYVPMTWDDDSIANYTQALLDELYLIDHEMQDCKTIEQIEQSFAMEIVLL